MSNDFVVDLPGVAVLGAGLAGCLAACYLRYVSPRANSIICRLSREYQIVPSVLCRVLSAWFCITYANSGLNPNALLTYRRRGFAVDLFDSRADMRRADQAGGRSINLVLTSRGFNALNKVNEEPFISLSCILLKRVGYLNRNILHQFMFL